MATPAAILSILVDVNSGKASVALAGVQRQLVETNTHATALEQHSGKLSKSLGSISAPAEKSRGSLKHLGEAALAAGGAFAAFEAAKSAIDSTLELGHATERLTAITGLGVKQASTWIETMKVRGVQTKAVGMAFITLSRNVRTAQDADTSHLAKIKQLVDAQKLQRDALEATGASHQKLTILEQKQQEALDKLSGPSTNKAVAAFAELGVSQDTLRSKNTEKVLLAVADGMSKIEDPTRRAALAQQIFGRGAQGLIPILAEGRKGVEDALAATQRYGAFLPQNVKQLKDSVEAQHNLNLAMDGLKISFTTAVLPSLVQGAGKLLEFIAQMRAGKGAGGDFANAIKTAFNTIKTVVTDVVGSVGGLGNALKIAVAAFAAQKIYEFTLALKALFLVIKTSPVGALLTAVTLLFAAFDVLSRKQHSAAETAREVHDAWDQAKTAADALRDANLNVVQAKLDHIKADEALKASQDAVTAAADKYGKNSPQYKQAEEDLAQAKVDSKRASNSLSDALGDQTKKQSDSTSQTQKAIDASRAQVATDKGVISSIQDQIKGYDRMGFAQQHGTTGANLLKDAQDKLAAANRQLESDQGKVNAAINAMPGHKLSVIGINVDFESNISNAIKLIAQNVGGTLTGIGAKVAGHFSGGMVTQPGYFAGEEAPQHPEVILATNPAYRSRNLGLWAQAGNMLGVPGFATGGLSSADAQEVGGVQPWASKAAGSWMNKAAAKWVAPIKQQLIQMASFGGGSVGNLANLWVQGGGPANVAQIMGAIAMAESGGKNVIQQGQPYSTTGWGLWQITPGNSEPQFGINQALLIPINNARAAVAKYSSQGLGAWTTYTSGAYKQFLGAAAGGGGGAAGGGGLGTFDGLRVANWIIPELAYARQHGWGGRITSGYRPGFDPHAPSGSEHALTAYPGGAVDFGGMVDPAGFANRQAFEYATVGYKGLRLIPPVGFRDDGHMSGTGHKMGGIHGKVRGFAKGGIFGKALRAGRGAGRIHGYAQGGIHGKIPGFAKGGVALPSAGSIIGLPGLPSGGTQTVPSKIAGSISDYRNTITGLEQSFSAIDSFYGLAGSADFVDPDTGLRNEKAIKARLDQLAVLIAYRQRIFAAWSMVVALTQRLISANETMARAFKAAAQSISTKGLKGNALTSAKNHIASLNTQSAQYSTNAGSARTALSSAIGDRSSAWISLQGLLGEKLSVAGTVAQAAQTVAAAVDTTGAALDNAPVTDDATVALLQQQLQQANLRTAVSQAQYATLPFGGSFATGGIVPGPLGAPSVIIAHGGETVTPAGPTVHVHIAPGMDWLRQFISVEVDSNTRGQARNASRSLPGSR